MYRKVGPNIVHPSNRDSPSYQQLSEFKTEFKDLKQDITRVGARGFLRKAKDVIKDRATSPYRPHEPTSSSPSKQQFLTLPSATSSPAVMSTTGSASGPGTRDKDKEKEGRESKEKVKMSLSLAALIVYTVGVKCRGFNKKEHYAVEHVFSLSERTANKVLRESMADLIKHNRTHVVRVYPNGTRLSSSNYEPHRYWASGTQLVAINWQTFGTWLLFSSRGARLRRARLLF